ncbi:MAG: O-antigen ligase family protein [Chloroflexota bacterium]|nr:O-antigen ligase family protein [Chloroflexota bacterium]
MHISKRLLSVFETVLLAVSTPFLLFPHVAPTATLLALLGLVVVWSVYWIVERHPLPSTPMNGALLLWGVAVVVGIAVTAFPELTLPKATGLILGLAVWRYLVVMIQGQNDFRWALVGSAAVGLGIMGLGAFSARWYYKVPGLQNLVTVLPPQLLSLPEAPQAGVSTNQLAGVVAFYLPVALAAVLFFVERWGSRTAEPRRCGKAALGFLASVAGVTAVGGLLILTQSRSGWVGGLVGVGALLFAWGLFLPQRWGRYLSLGLVVTVIAVGAILYWNGKLAQIAALWDAAGGVKTELIGTVTLSGRVEIWSRALYAVQDFPFTGCGLGTFREVIWSLYPLFTISPGHDIAHAHNIFLQTAVDVGLPGLLAYLALLSLAGVIGVRMARRSAGERALGLGIVAGLMALHIYGLTDALAPGSKPALVFWIALGLLAARGRSTDWRDQGKDRLTG